MPVTMYLFYEPGPDGTSGTLLPAAPLVATSERPTTWQTDEVGRRHHAIAMMSSGVVPNDGAEGVADGDPSEVEGVDAELFASIKFCIDMNTTYSDGGGGAKEDNWTSPSATPRDARGFRYQVAKDGMVWQGYLGDSIGVGDPGDGCTASLPRTNLASSVCGPFSSCTSEKVISSAPMAKGSWRLAAPDRNSKRPARGCAGKRRRTSYAPVSATSTSQ